MFATAKSAVPDEGKKISETYQKLTQREHILKRPDSYSRSASCLLHLVGSVTTTTQAMWVYDEVSQSMKYKNINYVRVTILLFSIESRFDQDI